MSRIAAAVSSALAAAAVILTLLAAPAGAAPRTHRCAGLASTRAGVRAWMDNHQGAHSTLYRGIDAAICTAADHASIEIKSWFIDGAESATSRRLAAHLNLMRRYHHVHVTVVVGRNGYPHGATWSSFRRLFRPFRVISCAHQCGTATRRGISHSKFVLVSKLRGAGTLVISTSTNFTDQQFATTQSAVAVFGSAATWSAFHARFRAETHHQVRRAAATWRTTAPGIAVYFAPSSTYPERGDMRAARANCAHGGLVEATALRLAPGIVTQMHALQHAGCTVRVLVEHVSPLAGIRSRCAALHDKAIVIDTSQLREVIAGSSDFGGGSVTNEQQMLRVRHASVVVAYERQFAAVWRHPRACMA